MKRLPFNHNLIVRFACVLTLTTASGVRAEVAEAVQAFDAGNSHYAVGNYRGAVDSYREALAEGYASTALFYNLGNAHFRLDELGEAILAYERARLLAPDDPEVRHNLSIAHEQTVDQFSRLPTPYWQRAWQAVVRRIGPWPLFVAGLVLWLTAAGVAIKRALGGPGGPWQRRILSIAVLTGGALLIAAFWASVSREYTQRGVVLAQEVDLVVEPSPTASTEITIHEGVVVHLLRRRGEWIFVQLPNGARGWAQETTIGEITL
jgi:tetratricopeptide (TPR) repeat protein